MRFSTVAFFLLVAIAFSLSASAQNIRIKGVVKNDAGQPVQRPSVQVKGTTAGVTGDDNGNFEISAPSNSTLLISAVDFATQEVKVNGRASLTVSLVPLNKSLGEVIVIGYGTARKKDVTGAVVSVSGTTLKEVPSPNLIAQLKGRT
ncbi:MAG TPA: carboxypeptidase-like regulatory domain-containing protein, partial [Chitinophagaceae bacterium]|nr:carboxypeptidase-like regulatory domain-containing protein [Chitinophagaceae bacterium]